MKMNTPSGGAKHTHVTEESWYHAHISIIDCVTTYKMRLQFVVEVENIY